MFYDRIYAVCKEKKTSPTAVLQALGCSSGNISKWKSGSVPNLDLAFKIAQYLGVSLDYLVTGSQPDTTLEISKPDPDFDGLKFYNRVKKVCNEKDAKLTQVIRDLNLDIGCIGRWKNGLSPTLADVCKIADYLNTSLDYLVTGQYSNGTILNDNINFESPDIIPVSPSSESLRISFYDNLKRICKYQGTSPTKVLTELGMSTGNTGKWKNGSVPNIDIAYRISQYLGVSLDYLVTGQESNYRANTGKIDPEWIDIITHIPEERQQMCKDFMRTHMVIPQKYSDKKNA